MTVKEIKPEIVVLEYRQDKDDEDYGSCLWARFYFNLDKYELSVLSDCGNYVYKWYETPDSESFLELMARIEKDYLLDKLCGSLKEFDYEATKENIYDWWSEESEVKEKLDEIFSGIECYGEPECAETFLRLFDNENDGYFCDIWEMPVYVYSRDQERICQVFAECIQPRIKEILENEKRYERR